MKFVAWPLPVTQIALRGYRMKCLLFSLLFVATLSLPAAAASVSRTYSYFNVGGKTFEELQFELQSRGPMVQSTGKRHAGATRMEFNSRIKYGQSDSRCKVVSASVSVKAQVILPRWTQRRSAGSDVRFFWDTLSSDIKRHEESHIVIARTHAREMEMAIAAIRPRKTCEAVAAEVKTITQQLMGRHDRAQDEFDRVEGINFENRMLRLMRYRIERMESGRERG